ncbi:hypothetical protein PTI45_02050 [Paenibacillus nuruki]|uniref:Uncharacterized protein n=1 Tax=Paenibacillus nuruki TaxID=1886670 RepID=A0A1E3L5Q2_9BACL|nr:hypothetical protein [Paenibacillus nuruki]ODP28505.1 hypothetical protein PTI45_02050 [Paenibacillus nuruki]
MKDKMAKEQKQFEEVLQRSTNHSADCFSIVIGEEVKLIGFSQAPLTVPSAVLLLKLNNAFLLTGWVDEQYSHSFTQPSALFSSKVIIAVDCRTPSNQKFYLSMNEKTYKFGPRSEERLDDYLSLFWESELGAGLVICQYDAIREEMIRSLVGSPDDGSRKFLKANIMQKIEFYSHIYSKKQMEVLNPSVIKEEFKNEGSII